MTKCYQVVISEMAFVDIIAIKKYIKDRLKNDISAVKISKEIISRIKSLKTFPERFQIVNDDNHELSGLRITHVGSYNIYYRVDNANSIVNVDRVLYGGVDIRKIAIN